MENSALRGATDDTVYAEGVKLQGNKSLTVDHTAQLTAALSGSDLGEEIESVQWSSSNTAVATVKANADNSATVTGKANGQVTIAALVTTNKGNVYVSKTSFNVTTPATAAYAMQDGEKIDALTLTPTDNTALSKKAALTVALDPKLTSDTIYGVQWSVGEDSEITLNGHETQKAMKNSVAVESGAKWCDADDVVTITASAETNTNVIAKVARKQVKVVDVAPTEGQAEVSHYEPDFENDIISVTIPVTVVVPADGQKITVSPETIQLKAKDVSSKEQTVTVSIDENCGDKIVGVYAASTNDTVTVTVNEHNVTAAVSDNATDGSGKIVVMITTERGGVITKTIDVTIQKAVETAGQGD